MFNHKLILFWVRLILILLLYPLLMGLILLFHNQLAFQLSLSLFSLLCALELMGLIYYMYAPKKAYEEQQKLSRFFSTPLIILMAISLFFLLPLIHLVNTQIAPQHFDLFNLDWLIRLPFWSTMPLLAVTTFAVLFTENRLREISKKQLSLIGGIIQAGLWSFLFALVGGLWIITIQYFKK